MPRYLKYIIGLVAISSLGLVFLQAIWLKNVYKQEKEWYINMTHQLLLDAIMDLRIHQFKNSDRVLKEKGFIMRDSDNIVSGSHQISPGNVVAAIPALPVAVSKLKPIKNSKGTTVVASTPAYTRSIAALPVSISKLKSVKNSKSATVVASTSAYNRSATALPVAIPKLKPVKSAKGATVVASTPAYNRYATALPVTISKLKPVNGLKPHDENTSSSIDSTIPDVVLKENSKNNTNSLFPSLNFQGDKKTEADEFVLTLGPFYGLKFDLKWLKKQFNNKIYENGLTINYEMGSFLLEDPGLPINDVNEQTMVQIVIKEPVFYLLKKMGWQLFISLLLTSLPIICLIYMLKTLFKQKKLAVLKKDFINNMTHELKTPLATVSAAVDAMQSYGGLEDKTKAELYLEISKKELNLLDNLIEKVLDMAESDDLKKDFYLERADINILLKNLVNKYNITGKNLNIKLTSEGIVSLLLVDKTHITNAICNLIENAIKYSKKNTTAIIHIHHEIIDNYWELKVKDNGIGIALAYQAHVFDRFFRAPMGDIHDVKGYGLGLYYVKQIIDLHNGSISLETKEGIGSCFRIKLPITK